MTRQQEGDEARTVCDGNHAGPLCRDKECWLAGPKPEDETTLPATTRPKLHILFDGMARVYDHTEADKLFAALEAERDSLKTELLLHVNRTLRNAVVGQETAEQAFERGQRVMRDYLASQFDSQIDFASSAGSLCHCLEFPYTSPLKAGTE